MEGSFCQYDPLIFSEQLNYNQKFFPLEEVEIANEEDKKNNNFKLNSGGTDEEQMEKALAESMKEFQKSQQNIQPINKPENDKEKYFKGEKIQFINNDSKTKCYLKRS